MKERTSIMAAVVITLLLVGTASAYSVSNEFKGKEMTDDKLYNLAISHNSEPWAQYIINDMGYRYSARNHEQLKQRMKFQAMIPKTYRNNMVGG